MITLYTFGSMFGLPDPSPPCMKAEVLLKMADLPYTLDHTGFTKAPKGKLPYIDDDGMKVPDSAFIRWHIETKYALDLDQGLTQAERGQAWAFERLCEDNLYFAVSNARWLDDANFARGPAHFFDAAPALLRPAIRSMVRRKVRNTLHLQGLGRHSNADLDRIAIRGIDAISAHLGDKPWLMGAEPCSADASVFATITGLLCPLFETPLLAATQRHTNLVAYRDRGLARWYPGFKV
jgi:glutathione S-transferase